MTFGSHYPNQPKIYTFYAHITFKNFQFKLLLLILPFLFYYTYIESTWKDTFSPFFFSHGVRLFLLKTLINFFNTFHFLPHNLHSKPIFNLTFLILNFQSTNPQLKPLRNSIFLTTLYIYL